MISNLTKLYVGKRVLATLIDYTVVWAFSFFYIFEFGAEAQPGHYSVDGWPALVPVLFWFIYIVIAEYFAGATLGHAIFKIRVESQTSERLTFWRTFVRRIVDALEISWCFGFIAFLLARNTQYNQRLGDILAKTYVIGKDDLVRDIEFDFEKAS